MILIQIYTALEPTEAIVIELIFKTLHIVWFNLFCFDIFEAINRNFVHSPVYTLINRQEAKFRKKVNKKDLSAIERHLKDSLQIWRDSLYAFNKRSSYKNAARINFNNLMNKLSGTG